MSRLYLSTTIPYVNARPHVGYALELVQADVLARHHRRTGDEVRLQSGTDDNSLKNVLAARSEGIGTAELVNRNAAAFAALRDQLSVNLDDFLRTSADPRHRPGVEALWRACEAAGDLYRREYEGLYCTGCEQFYAESELAAGRCPEHGTAPETVREQNWFFRLSRYQGRLRELIASGALAIEPASRRNEVLGFIDGGLADFSVSRPAARSGGWGIPVPGDPGQVIYVWWDALANYVTSLRYGAPGPAGAAGHPDYQRWWAGADERVHLVGKGVLRFHAVYWPAILASAGEPLPTRIYVHDYLTAGGAKISKSGPGAGTQTDPAAVIAAYGADALRWWLLTEVPRSGDADFTIGRLISRANADLAGGVGNLVSRVATLAARYRGGAVAACARPAGTSRWLAAAECGCPAGGPPWPGDAAALAATLERTPAAVAAALARFDFRAASAAVFAIVSEANRYVETTAPWQLGRAAAAGDTDAAARLEEVLGALVAACQVLAAQLWPFLPDLAARVAAAADDSGGTLPTPRPVFPRIATGPRPSTASASEVA